jgi:hypothetical protein
MFANGHHNGRSGAGAHRTAVGRVHLDGGETEILMAEMIEAG